MEVFEVAPGAVLRSKALRSVFLILFSGGGFGTSPQRNATAHATSGLLINRDLAMKISFGVITSYSSNDHFNSDIGVGVIASNSADFVHQVIDIALSSTLMVVAFEIFKISPSPILY